MTIQTKFNIGDKVYFWSINRVAILYGEIDSVSVYMNKGKNAESKYGVQPIIKGNKEFFSEFVPEHLVFKRRDDVFDFCMKLTQDI